MARISQINYEETSSFSKKFHADSDDFAQLHSTTRQRVQALRKDWAGEAAEAFFEEMEAELLPALQRVSAALLLGAETLNKIMKIIHEADEDTVRYFKEDLQTDIGLGRAGPGADLPGGKNNGSDGGIGSGDAILPGGGDPSITQPDIPAKPDETVIDPPGQFVPADIPPAPEPTKLEEIAPVETETAGSASAGGEGGGAASQGLQGDLKGIGDGSAGSIQQAGSASAPSEAGAGAQTAPDHVYEGSSSSQPQPAAAPAGSALGGSTPGQASGGVAGVVGGAGIAGAAAAAAKIFQNDNSAPKDP